MLDVVRETHGLVLLLPLAGLAVWLYVRYRRSQARRAQAEQARIAHLARQAEIEQHRRSVATDLVGLMSISPYEFEHVVAAVLRGAGYREVQVTQGSGDRGIDVVGVDHAGLRMVVQCKQYSSKVGGPAVRNLAGSRVQAGADRALLVTTAGFTREALEASRVTGVELMDGEQFVMLARAARAPGSPESAEDGAGEDVNGPSEFGDSGSAGNYSAGN